LEVVLIDVTESSIQRPKKGQKAWYSGKKKQHTIKTQIIVDAKTRAVISIAQGKGKEHDFKLYCRSIGVKVLKEIKIRGDSGYQGIKGKHANSETPKKKPRGGKLTKEEKSENRRISKERIKIEHINASLKIFKILTEKYRNRRHRHGLRMSLLCGIFNQMLTPV
jgi:hypothetical protein